MSDTYPRNAATADEALIGDDVMVDVEEAPAPNDAELAKVRDLALKQVELLKRVISLQEQLDAANAALKLNQEVELPDLLLKLGVTNFGLRGGHSVDLQEIVNASIPKDEAITREAHAWLEDHKHFVVKRRIQIFFGRDDMAWAKKFLADCARRKKPLQLEEKEWVEPQTLGALVREQLSVAKSTGQDPETLAPSNLLGVFKLTKAVVSGPNVPKPKKKGGAK